MKMFRQLTANRKAVYFMVSGAPMAPMGYNDALRIGGFRSRHDGCKCHVYIMHPIPAPEAKPILIILEWTGGAVLMVFSNAEINNPNFDSYDWHNDAEKDSLVGDIRDAADIWNQYHIETIDELRKQET